MLRYLRGGGQHTKTIWWILIIVTVVTFLGGFVFLLGSGLGGGMTARATGAVALVNGDPLSRADYTQAVNDQRSGFQNRVGAEPGERELKSLETQAFRGLVMQRLLDQQAKKLGLEAHDHEVLLTLQSSPPPALTQASAFQTGGRFDPQKYQAAMRDPANNWGPFEDMVRRQLPVRKLQERLYTSVKLTETDLKDLYRQGRETVSGTFVLLAPNPGAPPANVSDAELQRVYDKYKSRFTTGAQRQLEVLIQPKDFGDREVKAADELTKSLIARIRAGESFLQLSREYSDAPGADAGGVIDRVLQPSEFGAELGPKVALMDTGQVTDAVRDGGRFLFFKVLAKAVDPSTGRPGVRVAHFIVRVKPDEEKLRKQYEELGRLRSQAKRDGLGRAAAAHGLATTKTPYFDLNNLAQQLAAVPEAADWAFGAKKNEVSPVIEALDHFAVVQLVGAKPAGPPPREELTPQLRQIAQLEAEINALQTRADSLAAALKQGRTLEQAAALVGTTTVKIDAITRESQDPRLVATPAVLGALFAAKPGEVVGPVRGLGGFVAARLEQRTEPDWKAFEQQQSQMAQQMLDTRQRAFLDNYSSELRAQARVKDLRGEAGY